MTRLPTVFTLVGYTWLTIFTCVQLPVQAEPSARATAESTLASADSLLLDQFPDTHAALSLRRLSSSYTGPILTVRRGSDNATQDFGLDGDVLDVSAIEDWLSGAEGFVVQWHTQRSNGVEMKNTTNSEQPRIADASGSVFTDQQGNPAIKFDRSRGTYLSTDDGVAFSSWNVENTLTYVVADTPNPPNTQRIVDQAHPEGSSRMMIEVKGGGYNVGTPFTNEYFVRYDNPSIKIANFNNGVVGLYENNYRKRKENFTGSQSHYGGLTLGTEASSPGSSAYDALLSEVAVLPGQAQKVDVQSVYDNANSRWNVGPTDYNKGTLIPQEFDWQIAFYDWLEQRSKSDFQVDSTLTISTNVSDLTNEQRANAWYDTHGAGASAPTNASPKYFVLDDGSGNGIEATGSVRVWHEPEWRSGRARSFGNEPAYLYRLSVPDGSGGEGNEFKGHAPLAYRSMVVSMVDMAMYPGENYSNELDMAGKAYLAWAQAYKWAGDILSPEMQKTYEAALEYWAGVFEANGPKAANTNMDMFSIFGLAEAYDAATTQSLKDAALAAAKRNLLGPNGESVEGSNHEVDPFNSGGGMFYPAGYFAEGDTPEVFYNGESFYQLMGAYSALMDKSTGNIPSEWSFLEEMVKRVSDWKSHQLFYAPGSTIGGTSADHSYDSGASFGGRTAGAEPENQAGEYFRDIAAASVFSEARYLSWEYKGRGPVNGGATEWPSLSRMKIQLNDKLSKLENLLQGELDQEPPKWDGWSPWSYRPPYQAKDGWYTDLKDMQANNKPATLAPVDKGNDINRAFGGPPTGKEWWRYQATDSNGRTWGFWLEADAQQGSYGGSYGGKVESFWTEDTGIDVIGRRGQAGSWNLPRRRPAHHVVGLDENDNAFTTALLRGVNLSRTSNFNLGATPPTVTVTNTFNDGTSQKNGEETSDEIQGDLTIENKFEAEPGGVPGLRITHTITSDQTDEINELWAALPIHLRQASTKRGGDQPHGGYPDATIEYWDGGSWQQLPPVSSGNPPTSVNTTALRRGFDYQLGDGMQYTYFSFANPQDIRRANGEFETETIPRNSIQVTLIDLHGDPGNTKTMPGSKSVSYTIQTTDPTLEGGTSASQVISLQKGWNITSTFISPTAPAMDSVFADLQSKITVVENEAGERYRPSEDINEIGQWNSEEAYRIYAESDITLTIQGDSLGTPSISLEEGWNLIPYFLSSPLSVDEAVSSVAEDLVLVKDGTGRAYLPGEGIEELTQMEPGEGYKIHVSQPTTLTYPDGSN
jgi:hypothetical protein